MIVEPIILSETDFFRSLMMGAALPLPRACSLVAYLLTKTPRVHSPVSESRTEVAYTLPNSDQSDV